MGNLFQARFSISSSSLCAGGGPLGCPPGVGGYPTNPGAACMFTQGPPLPHPSMLVASPHPPHHFQPVGGGGEPRAIRGGVGNNFYPTPPAPAPLGGRPLDA